MNKNMKINSIIMAFKLTCKFFLQMGICLEHTVHELVYNNIVSFDTACQVNTEKDSKESRASTWSSG